MTSPLWLVVPAAGIGQRMGADRPKQYLNLLNHYLLDITLQRLLNMQTFAGCVVPLHPNDRWWASTLSTSDSRIMTCAGGSERSDSVLSALRELDSHAAPTDWVLVHDMARPCLDSNDLSQLIEGLRDNPVGGLLATPVTDTLKQADKSGHVATTVDRSRYWRALTPQMFRLGILRESLEHALASNRAITDESSAIELMKPGASMLIEGRADNLKVTVPGDIELATFILQRNGWHLPFAAGNRNRDDNTQ